MGKKNEGKKSSEQVHENNKSWKIKWSNIIVVRIEVNNEKKREVI